MRPFPPGCAAFAVAVAGLAVAAATAVAALAPSGVAAFPLAGCQLSVTSLDAEGRIIDMADGSGDAGSQQDPLRVTWDGIVAWQGGTGAQAIRDTSWHVDMFGLPTPLRGGDANPEGDRTGSDSLLVGEAMPFRFTGLYHVSGRLEGNGGSCSGSGWILLLGDPATTLPFSIGLGLILVGAVLLAVGARGSWWSALAGGLLLGIGTCVTLVIFAILPFGAATPLVALVAGLAAGLLAGWYGRGQARRAQPASAA